MQQPDLLGTEGDGEYAMNPFALIMRESSASVRAPRFDGTGFETWQARMKNHIQYFNPLVWRIVETGFSCVDEANPTALELRNIHYNAQAMNAIYCALSDDQLYRIWHLDSAKEVWNALQVVNEETPIVRELKVKQSREKMKLFKWRKHESSRHMFMRLENLVLEMKRLGCQEVTNSYAVRKMLHAMKARDSTFVTIIRERPNFEELTPLDVLHSFIVYEDSKVELRRMRRHAAKVDTVTQSKAADNDRCSGEAPCFDGTHYLSWQRRMKFHLLSIDPLVWRIVETGFSCVDEANPTVLESRNMHYNARAMCTLCDALSVSQFNMIRQYESAKEIWDAIRKFNEAVREPELSLWRSRLAWFTLGKHESSNDMYTRLNNLVNEMKGLGCKDMTDSYVVKKILHAMTQWNPNLALIIREKPNFELLTPRDVLAKFQLYDMEQEESEFMSGYALPRSRTRVNAALKAKQVHVEESSDDENDHDQDQEQIQHRMQELTLLMKKYKGLLGKKGYEARRNFSDKSKTRKSKRYCYQCGDPNHFIADCPKKEDKKEENEKSKYKRKSFNNKGKTYKPEGQKDVEVLTSDDQVTEPWKLKRGLPRKPAAQPAQQHYCLSAHLVQE